MPQMTALVPGDMLSDGSYSERIISRATQIVLNDFNLTAAIMTEENPVTDYALNDAFDLVKISMNIDIEKLREPVVKNILVDYTKACVSHLLKSEDPVELAQRVRTAHKIKILVYECYVFNIGIPEKQALKLLELMYRYASHGYRYSRAFYKLLSSLTSEAALNNIFAKFIEHFDPTLQSIPSMAENIKAAGALNAVYSSFIRKLYEKLSTLINPIEDAELYARHATMMITSIICLNDVDGFTDILMNLMPYVDPIELLVYPNFFVTTLKIIPRAGQNNTLLLDRFVGLFLNDSVISRIEEDNVKIRIGGIYFYSHKYANEITRKHFRLLSIERKAELKRMEKRFIEIEEMFNRAKDFVMTQINFLELSVENLQSKRQEFDELTDNFDILMKIFEQQFSDTIFEIIKTLIKICGDAMRHKMDKKLNFERFRLFMSILNSLTADKSIIQQVHPVLFMNLRFFWEVDTETTDVADVLKIVKFSIDDFLQTKNDFVTDKKLVKILYKFFIKLLGQESGFEEFRKVIFAVLEGSQSFSVTCDLIRDFCNEMEVSVSDIFVPILIEEIKRYLAVRTNLLTYNNGRLLELISKLEAEKAFNRTETLIIEAFKRIFPVMNEINVI